MTAQTRRGRPPNKPAAEPEAGPTWDVPPAADDNAPRLGDPVLDATPRVLRRKRGASSGASYKLGAPSRPGYVRRFVNDTPGRVEAMQELGYDFAKADTRNDGMGSNIARNAGRDDQGKPIMAILMETPAEEYAIGDEEREARLRPFDEAIKRGADTTGAVQDAYSPTSVKSTITHSR